MSQTPYQELIERKRALEFQVNQLDREIEAAQDANRDAVVKQIQSMMVENGVSFNDLRGIGGGGVKVRSARRSTSGLKGAKVAPKYRDPESSSTWSGRGLRPNWLKTALQQGRKLEDFAIGNATS